MALSLAIRLGLGIGARSSAPPPPPSTAKAPILSTIDPVAAWTPIAQGVQLPAGNNASASEISAYFTQGDVNPGIWKTAGGFFLWAGRLPQEAFQGNRIAVLFLASTPTGNRLRVNGTGTATNPNTITFGWSRSGIVPSAGSISGPRPTTETDLLIAVVRDPTIVIGTGTSLRLVIISLRTGAVLSSTTFDPTGNGYAGSSTNVGFGGGWGKGDNTVATSTATVQGDLYFAMSGSGAYPTDSVLQQIALGAAPETVISGVTWDFYRDLKAFPYAAPANVFAPGGITETLATGSVPNGTGFFPANTARRQSATVYLRPTMTWRRGEIFGIKPGQSSKTFTITAEASAGVQPECRIVQRGGGVLMDWTQMTPAGGGNWTLSPSLGWFGDWAVIEWRDALDPTNVLKRALWTEYFAVGPIFAFYGQSELENNWANNVGLGLTLDAGATRKVVWANANASIPEFTVLTATTRAGADGIYSTVNQWIAGGGGPCIIAMDAKGGTPNGDSLGGAWPTRPYANYLATAAVIGTSNVTVVYHWGVNDNGLQNTWGVNYWNAVWFGTGPAVGTANMPSALSSQNFRAVYSNPSFIAAPLGRKRSGSAGPLTTPQVASYARNRRSLATWATANGFKVGPHMGDVKLADQFHQQDGSPMGDRLIGARLAQACLRAFNLWPASDPSVAAVTLTSPNVYTVTFNRTVGGAMYSPAPTALTGWMVNDSIVGFTAALVGNTVTITKTSGNWTGSETIKYEHDAPRDVGTADPVADDAQIAGALYETYAGDKLGLGLPVVPYW